jgi:FMN phosphatase YigB (HAD superfamily)
MLLIFDLDDTLIPTSKELTPIRLKRALKSMIDNGLKSDFEKGFERLNKINSEVLRSKIAIEKFSFEVAGSNDFARFGVEMLESPLDDIQVEELKDLNLFLSSLRENYKLAIVTGGNQEVQREKITLYGIDVSLFEEVIVAEWGQKEAAYQSLSQKHGAFLVVGDRIEYDLSAAKKLGGITVHIRQGRGELEPEEHPNVDFKIKTINELKEVLKRL